MSEAKFTKGEWVVSDYSDFDRTMRVMNGNITIAATFNSVPEFEANAHLIAAAPAMYDEIERDIQNLYQSLCDIEYKSLRVAAVEKKIERKSKLLARARGE